jgi:GNAT superfamily N-acetyltransferase
MRSIMNAEVFIKKGYQISTDKTLLNVDIIHKYLNEGSYWAKGIPIKTLKNAIDNSICFGIYTQEKQAGFARVITDKATFAYICDVFVLDEFRGHGLSKWLIQTIVEYPELQKLRR